MKSPQVSVFVLTKNEESNIELCLNSLREFEDVTVVDSSSTDRTVEIAQRMGARVVDFSWNGQYPKKKQWQLDNLESKYQWVLMLDADESPSPELIDSMRKLGPAADDPVAAYDVRLSYWFAGRELVHGHRVVKRALLDRSRCSFPEVGDLHIPGITEVEGHYQPIAKGRTEVISGRILHRDLDPVRTWFDRHNRYSEWEAHLLENDSSLRAVSASRSKQGQLFARLPMKPIVFFLYSYLLRRGFLDGRAGLDYALALAFYYWQIALKRREIRR